MKSKYNGSPSSTYAAATAGISELLKAEGLGSAQAAVAEALSQSIKDEYQRSSGLTPRKGHHVCSNRLFGAPKCKDRWDKPCDSISLPVTDHESEWVDETGKAKSIVTHPWVLYKSDLHDILQTCNEKGLDVLIGHSWEYPGRRLMIEYKRKGRE